MTADGRILDSFPCLEYRRAARRLRWLHAGRPARLQRSLSELARRHDAASQPIEGRQTLVSSVVSVRRASSPPSPCLPSGLADQPGVEPFADMVADDVEGSILSYSKRVTLLHEAERLGLGRFHANLIIAAVQHRAGRSAAAPRQPAQSPIASLTLAAAIQLIIVLGVWVILR